MVQAYNFLASWQLFPEKCTYEFGNRPKSGLLSINKSDEKNKLIINTNWVSLENKSFGSKYEVMANNEPFPFYDKEYADTVVGNIINSISFEISFIKSNNIVLHVLHEIMPNGYLKIKYKGKTDEGKEYKNVEIYHKQMSVLPYSSSVSGAVIKATEEGVIKHKALTAMEEQTNMQLEQIRKQIELLALQAQEIQSRKELSMIIYDAKINFQPVIGQIYHLYEKHDDSYVLSMVAPKEWGTNSPYKSHYAQVQLLADHTWKEVI